jgi:hypothetical protein
MTKRFALMPYDFYFQAWRGLALTLFVLSAALLFFDPAEIRPYRSVLMLAAGLGVIVLAWGFGMSRLAFAAAGRTAVVIQLPFWRVRIPYNAIKSTRMVSLDKAAPERFKEVEMAELSAVMLDLERWPQPQPLLAFWLGRLVLPDGILLPVDDVIGLRRAIDAGLQELKEGERQPLPVRQY